MAKILRGVGALCLLAIVALGVLGIVYNIRFPAPKEIVSQSFWIPPNAEIRSSDEVHPGTFKIDTSVEDLERITRPDESVLVVYDTSDDADGRRRAAIEYFRPNPDIEGTFHYLRIVFSLPDKSWLVSLLTGWDVDFDKESSTFQYTLVKEYWMLVGSSIMALVAGAILFLSIRWGIKKRRLTTDHPVW